MPQYDIAKLLQYGGPSTRQEQVTDSWVTILDYRNSDENERKTAILLSSQGIPFRIDRPGRGWSQSKLRLFVMVPREFLGKANALLSAAAAETAIERVEGMQGLPGFRRYE